MANKLIRRWILGAFLVAAAIASTASRAESRNLAPGFTMIEKGASVLVMPPDIELLSISAGGVAEPKADWTEAAQRNFNGALGAASQAWGVRTAQLSEKDADDTAEINALHAAVARSIAFHHITGGGFSLPTKKGLLDWSLGDAVRPLRDRSKADYALFIWLRDSYASTERKLAMVAMALLGVGIGGGWQTGYASLVDLRTGRVLWFNRLLRNTGDLREAETTRETVDAFLTDFPEPK
jgi:hypothetical protein